MDLVISNGVINLSARKGQGALYPLFTAEVIRLLKQLVPPENHQAAAVAVVIRESLHRCGLDTTKDRFIGIVDKRRNSSIEASYCSLCVE